MNYQEYSQSKDLPQDCTYWGAENIDQYMTLVDEEVYGDQNNNEQQQ